MCHCKLSVIDNQEHCDAVRYAQKITIPAEMTAHHFSPFVSAYSPG